MVGLHNITYKCFDEFRSQMDIPSQCTSRLFPCAHFGSTFPGAQKPMEEPVGWNGSDDDWPADLQVPNVSKTNPIRSGTNGGFLSHGGIPKSSQVRPFWYWNSWFWGYPNLGFKARTGNKSEYIVNEHSWQVFWGSAYPAYPLGKW